MAILRLRDAKARNHSQEVPRKQQVFFGWQLGWASICLCILLLGATPCLAGDIWFDFGPFQLAGSPPKEDTTEEQESKKANHKTETGSTQASSDEQCINPPEYLLEACREWVRETLINCEYRKVAAMERNRMDCVTSIGGIEYAWGPCTRILKFIDENEVCDNGATYKTAYEAITKKYAEVMKDPKMLNQLDYNMGMQTFLMTFFEIVQFMDNHEKVLKESIKFSR